MRTAVNGGFPWANCFGEENLGMKQKAC